MSIVPELLLQPAAKAKTRPAPVTSPNAGLEASPRKAPSFAQVYARQHPAKPVERAEPVARGPRQDKPIERAEPVAKGARERFSSRCDDDAKVADPQVDRDQVAESGNALPDDPVENVAAAGAGDDSADDSVAPEATLDPLMLLALSGQLPDTTVEPTSVPVTAALGAGESGALDTEADTGQVLLTGLGSAAVGVASGAAATLTDASHDTTLDALNSATGVQLVVDLGAKAQVAGAQNNPATGPATTDFADSLASMSAQLQSAASGKLSDSALAELKALGADADTLKDASPELRTESLAERISALSQSASQPAPALGRPALLPGQPLAMQQSGWSEAMVDKVMWLSSQNLKSAEIQLDPADLGRLEVRVDMAKDQTQVTFASPHAGVRDALEGQMQRLRDLFTEQGMNLLDVNVSDQSLSRGWQGQEQGSAGEGARRGPAAAGLAGAGEEEHVTAVSELRGRSALGPRSLVDYYA